MRTMTKKDILGAIVILAYHMQKEPYKALYQKIISLDILSRENLLTKWENMGFVDAKDFCLWYGYC